MYVNVIRSYRDIVAVCDSDLLGKTFEEGNHQLDVKESFYKGEEMDKEETIKVIRTMAIEDATFNIAGKEAVETAIEAGIITEAQVGRIDNIPFSLVLL